MVTIEPILYPSEPNGDPHPSSGPQFSISSSHFAPELATVQVTVPELSYQLQVPTLTLTSLARRVRRTGSP